MAREAIARHALTCRLVCTYSCFLSDSTQLGNRTENSVVRGAMFSKVVLIALLGVLRRFQHHICQIARTVHILMRPG